MLVEIILNNKTAKRIIISCIMSVLLISALKDYSNDIMAGVTDNVLRLHIIANSNSDEDQELKLKVRDDISSYISELLRDSKTASDAHKTISENISQIENQVNKSILSNGYSYPSRAFVGRFYFPERIYENTVFPSGNYNALKIVIGNGVGKNWWCVLYPQLCFDMNNGDFKKNGYDKLKNTLSNEQYQIISDTDGINFKLKIVEMFSDR